MMVRSRVARLTAALAVMFAVSWGTPETAVGQTEQEEPPLVDLRLAGQPLWTDGRDPLGVRLRVTNNGVETLDGFALEVLIHPRVKFRSELELVFEGVTAAALGSTSVEFADRRIEVGGGTTVTIDEASSALERLLPGAEETGVYPLTISLRGRIGAEVLDTVTTTLLYYPSAPQDPLGLVPVVSLGDIPARGPGAVFYPEQTGGFPLETAVRPKGWLNAMVGALERWVRPQPGRGEPGERPPRSRDGTRARRRKPPARKPGLHLAIAPTPRLLEELADMADGYRREGVETSERVERDDGPATEAEDLLDRFNQLLDRDRTQPILVPYSFPDLPTIASLSLDRVAQQLVEAEQVLKRVTGRPPGRAWLFAPTGRVDLATLEQLRTLNAATRMVFDDGVLEPPSDPDAAGCPESYASFTCAVRVPTSQGPTLGFVADPGLEKRMDALVREGDDALDLHNLIAETAMIYEETPLQRRRVLPLVVPSLWRPPPRLSGALFRALATAPWLRTLTPREAMRWSDRSVPKHLVGALRPPRELPDPSFFDAIDDAESTIDSFGELIGDPPQGSLQNELLERLERDVLVAQSRTWWSSEEMVERGLEYATQAAEDAQRELSRVSVEGTGITLTSTRGELPLLIFNNNPYDVRVSVELESDNLDFATTTFEDLRIARESIRPLRVEASVNASGTFPLKVSVTTPDGKQVTERLFQVRSTQFNRVALGITAGALVFLILFYVVSAMRKRGATRPGSAVG